MKDSFLGYGNPKARFWFVGPEEAGDHTTQREQVWSELGSSQLLDLAEFHRRLADILEDLGEQKDAAGLKTLFPEKGSARLQPTWRPLIRLMHGLKRLPATNETLRKYQSEHWGRAHGETCLVELQGGCARVLSRGVEDNIRARGKAIMELMKHASPPLVVLYGERVCKHQKEIFGSSLETWTEPTENGRAGKLEICVGRWHSSVVVFTPHPNRRGMSNAAWDGITSLLQKSTGLS